MGARTLYIALTLLADGNVALARGSRNDLRKARELFFQGRYERVLSIVESLLLTDLARGQRVSALELEAFAYFLSNRQGEAERSWRELLEIDPNHELDPVDVPPQMVTFFQNVAPPTPPPDPWPPPEPAPEKPPAAKADDPSPLDPLPDRSPEPERGCGIWLCLIPFGGGQFANGNYVKGGLFAGAEALFLSLNIGMYWANQIEFEKHGGSFPDEALADRRTLWKHVFLGFFLTTLVYGVIDAYIFP